MSLSNWTFRVLLIAFPVLTWAGPVATVDRDTVRLNESFTYTLRMEGDAPVDPDFRALGDCCEILSNSRKTQIQSVNRQYERVTEWQLILMAGKTGKLLIPGVEIGNQRSNPIEISVLPARAGSTPGSIFMEVEAFPQHPYVQAETVYSVRLFVGTETDIRGPRLSEPRVEGGEAIIEKLGEDRRYQTERDDRRFDVIERRFSILPQVAGALTIEPLTFETQVLDGRRFSRIQRFRSDAIELMVKPVQPRPTEFPDADWLPARNIQLQEAWNDDTDEMVAGIPITRTVTVKADGLLETQIPELELGNGDGVKQYKDQPGLERQITGQGIRGVRVETMAVIIGDAGEYEIPGLELPWYDVIEERWRVARLASRELLVATNAEQTAAAALIQGPAPAGPAVNPETTSTWRWAALILGVGWLSTVLAWIFTRRRPVRRTNARDDVPSPSVRTVLKRLRKACRDDDAVQARRWALHWAGLYFTDNPPRNLAALAARVPNSLALPLGALDRHFYGNNPLGEWSGKDLLEGVKALDAVNGSVGDDDQAEALVPLYRT